MNRDTVSMDGSFEDAAVISLSSPSPLSITLSLLKCSPERFIQFIAFAIYDKGGIETERMSECETMKRHIAARQLGQTLHKSLARGLLMPAVLHDTLSFPKHRGIKSRPAAKQPTAATARGRSV